MRVETQCAPHLAFASARLLALRRLVAGRALWKDRCQLRLARILSRCPILMIISLLTLCISMNLSCILKDFNIAVSLIIPIALDAVLAYAALSRDKLTLGSLLWRGASPLLLVQSPVLSPLPQPWLLPLSLNLLLFL